MMISSYGYSGDGTTNLLILLLATWEAGVNTPLSPNLNPVWEPG